MSSASNCVCMSDMYFHCSGHVKKQAYEEHKNKDEINMVLIPNSIGK